MSRLRHNKATYEYIGFILLKDENLSNVEANMETLFYRLLSTEIEKNYLECW